MPRFRRRDRGPKHVNTDPMTAVLDHARIAALRAHAAGVWAVDESGEMVIWPRRPGAAWGGWRSMRPWWGDPALATREVGFGPSGGTIAGAGGTMSDALASIRGLPETHADDNR